MTITLTLKPDEAAALSDQARKEGTDIETLLHGMVAQFTPESQQGKSELTEKQKAAVALMQEWLTERDTLTADELEQNDRDFEDFKSNLNRWRTEEGRPPAFR